MLRVHTGYSFRQATGHPEEVIARLKEIGSEYAPITDRASTFGFNRWVKLAKKAGLKPVLGAELAVTPSLNAKKPSVDYWVFIPRKGVAAINRLVSLATQQFRYQAIINVEQAFKSVDECHVIIGHKPQIDWAAVPKGVYLGVSPATVKPLIAEARRNNVPLAATSDNRFTRPEDAGFYEILAGRNAEMQTYPQWLLSEGEWRKSIARLELTDDEIERAIKNSKKILADSVSDLTRARLPEPMRPMPLKEWCESFAEGLGVNLSDPVYRARLDRELSVIAEKGYEDYFYIVAELCQAMRKKMIVGPARGSSCGSLVCYLLGITAIDPIPYGLIFERFVDINRTDMPDIDIDFSDRQRHLVFGHLSEVYGPERVARIGTVAMYQPRSALNEVSAGLRVPKFKIESVAESIVERSSGDARALNTLEDTLATMPAGQKLMADHPEMAIVTRFEGHPRHAGQHAAGVVIASEPIERYVAIDHRAQIADGQIGGAVMCDKKDAEDGYNLLKIDALGLTQLSVFEMALELAGKTGMNTGIMADKFLQTIPLDDPEAFEVLNKKKFSGIFQFNGMALQSIVQQFKVTKLDDIVAVTALARPGPLASGGAHEWVRRKNGIHAVTYPHPIFEPYLKDTLGIVIYQEQVMEIGRNVGDLSWGQVSELRKAMSKSLGKEFFDQYGDPWKKAAISKGIAPAEAESVWDALCAYGSWSFNKSHSVAYGLISYWCCWMKAHMPYEFAAATLSFEHEPHRQIQMLRELDAEGIGYVPVHAAISGKGWTVHTSKGKKVLVGPLSVVDGIGPKLEQEILNARNLGLRYPDRALKLLMKAKTSIDSLWPIRDAFKRIMPDPAEFNINTQPTPIGSIEIEEHDREYVLFCTLAKINPRDENEAVLVARRGFERTDGKYASLNLQLQDDTGMIFGKVTRFDFEKLGRPIVDLGRTGKALYAFKGKVRGNGGDKNQTFKMFLIQKVKWIGDMDPDFKREDVLTKKIEEPVVEAAE